ncbi:MAG: hypothetical protein ABIS06_14430 [Vicinamibacterales bacterium]
MFTFHFSHRRVLRPAILIFVVFEMARLSARSAAPQDLMTPCERFGTMPAAFVGEVGAPIRHRMKAAPDAALIEITALPVTVERSFRGVVTNAVVYLYPLEAAMGSAPPGSAPVAGGRYLIYGAFNFGELKDVVMPTAIKPVDEAADDLAFLGASDPASKSGSISGVLVQGSMSNSEQKRTPLPGVTIRFRSRDTNIEVVSDDKGRYSVFDLPEGLVKIEPVLPDYLFGGSAVEVRAGGCTPQWIVAELNGRIRGRVLHHDGSPMTWMVSLLPANPRGGHVDPRGRIARADQNGDYEFSVVAPGDYLVGVNLNLPPNNGAPVPATYYPGTIRRQEAVPVVVGEGTVHGGIDITLPDPIRPVKLEVRIQEVVGASSSVVCLQDITTPLSAPGGTYTSTPRTPVVVDALEGSRYRLMAHVEHPGGHLESDVVEVTVASGHPPLTLNATVRAAAHAPGNPCGAFSISRQ